MSIKKIALDATAITSCIAGLAWGIAHLSSLETKVEAHEKEIPSIGEKLDTLIIKVENLNGKIDVLKTKIERVSE